MLVSFRQSFSKSFIVFYSLAQREMNAWIFWLPFSSEIAKSRKCRLICILVTSYTKFFVGSQICDRAFMFTFHWSAVSGPVLEFSNVIDVDWKLLLITKLYE